MKRIALIIALFASDPASALEAGGLVKASPAAEPAYDWSGFYAGLNAGLSATPHSGVHYNQLYNSPFVPISQPGLLIGGQAGYNWQSGIAVFGIETDIQYRNAGNGHPFLFPTEFGILGQPFGSSEDDTTHFNSGQNWLGSLRGRVGLTTGPALFYVTGGLAYGEVKHSYGEAVYPGQTINRSISDSTVKTGWTVGGGVEIKLSRNWSAGMEYTYADLGKTTLSMPEQNANTQFGPFLFAASRASFDNSSHVFRIKLNYALNIMN